MIPGLSWSVFCLLFSFLFLLSSVLCRLSSEIIDKPARLGYSVLSDFCSIFPRKENGTVRERERELRRRRKRKEESQRAKSKASKAEAAAKKGK